MGLGKGSGGGGHEIGRHLEPEIGLALLVGDAEGELGRVLGGADLDGDPVRAGLERHGGGEAVDVELAVAGVLEHGHAVPVDAEGAGGAGPERDAAGGAGPRLGGHHGGRVAADPLLGAHDLAEVEPAVGGGGGGLAPADGALLAVVGPGEVDGEAELRLGGEGAGEALLVLVVEGAQRHPAAEEAEAGDPGQRAVEVAAAAPGVGPEERGVDPGGRGGARGLGHRGDRLLDLGGIGPVPHVPDLTQRGVDLGPLGGPGARLGAEQIGVDDPQLGAGASRSPSTPPTRMTTSDERDRRGERPPSSTARQRVAGSIADRYPVPAGAGQGIVTSGGPRAPRGRGGGCRGRSRGTLRGARRDRARAPAPAPGGGRRR